MTLVEVQPETQENFTEVHQKLSEERSPLLFDKVYVEYVKDGCGS